MNYDSWKSTDRAFELSGPEPPPCEQNYAGRVHQHPRFPSGDCVVCGALCTEGCKYGDEPTEEQMDAMYREHKLAEWRAVVANLRSKVRWMEIGPQASVTYSRHEVAGWKATLIDAEAELARLEAGAP